MLLTQTNNKTNMAKLKKVEQAPVIETEEEFRTAVNRCAVLETQVETLKARKKERVAKLGAAFDDKVKPLDAEVKQLLKDCEAYADAHPEVLKPGTRSGETEAATYGYRTGNPEVALLRKKEGWGAVVARIVERGKAWAEALFAKREPEVSKEAILAAYRAHKAAEATPEEEAAGFTLSPAQLRELGVEVVQYERFRIEAKDKD